MDFRNTNWNSRSILYPSSTAPYSTDDGSAHNWSFAQKRPKNSRRAATTLAPPSILTPALNAQNGDQQAFSTQSFPSDVLTSAAGIQYSGDDGLSQAGQDTPTAVYDAHDAPYPRNEYAQHMELFMNDFMNFLADEASVQPTDDGYSQDIVFLTPPLIPDDSISEDSNMLDGSFDGLPWSDPHSNTVMQDYPIDQDVHRDNFQFDLLNLPMDVNDFAGYPTSFFSQNGYENEGLMLYGGMNSESLRANHSHMASGPMRRKQLWLNSEDEEPLKKVVKHENSENNKPSTSNVIASPTSEAETGKSRSTPGPSREIFSSESPPSSGEDELQDDTADESPSPAMAIDRSSGRPIMYKHRLLTRNTSPRHVSPRNTSSRYTQSKDVVGTDAIRNAGKNRRKTEAKFRCTWGNCTSEFTRRHNLNNHIKTHLGQAGTHCEKCGKELAQSSRRRHENKCTVKISTAAESP